MKISFTVATFDTDSPARCANFLAQKYRFIVAMAEKWCGALNVHCLLGRYAIGYKDHLP